MSRTRRAGPVAALEGVLALAVLVALLVGIPVLLLQLAEWPITGVPTWEQVKELPEKAVTDEVLFGVLTVAAWGAWALFVCSVVVEVVARARGRVSRVNIGGPLQRLAARLVGSLLLAAGPLGLPAFLPANTGAGRPVGLEQAVAVARPDGQQDVVLVRTAHAPQAPAAQQQVPPAAEQTAPGPAGASTVVVQPGDHFWGLAKSALTQAWGRAPSDSEMVGYWLDLVEANRHLLAPPHDPDLIYPQQVFTLPPLPADPLVPGAPAPSPPPEGSDDVVPDEPSPAPTTPDGGGQSGAPEGNGNETGTPQDQAPTTDSEGQIPDGRSDEQGQGGTGAPEAPPDEQGQVDDPSGGHNPDDIVPDEGMPTEDPENPGAPPPPATTDTTTDESDGSTDSTDETGGQGADESGEGATDTTGESGQPSGETDGQGGDESGESTDPTDTTGESGQPTDGTGDQGTDESGESTDTTGGTDGSGDGTTDSTDESGQPSDGTGGQGTDGSGESTDTTDTSGESGDGSTDTTGESGEGTTDSTDESGQATDGSGQPTDPSGEDEQAGEQPTDGTGDRGTDETSPDGTGSPTGGTGSGAGDAGSTGGPGSTDLTDGDVRGEPAANTEEDDGGGGSVVFLLAGGVMLGGALLGLDRLRRVQQRHRPTGKRIRMPQASLAEVEQTFRQAADVDGARLIDLALRAAAGRTAGTGLPALRWVEAQDDTVTLVVGSPVAPPSGFEWEGRDRWVSTASPDELAALAANMDAPTPALVPVGTTDDDAEVLIDLESSGVLQVVGSPDRVANVLRSLALAAATSPWIDESRVLLVGINGELSGYPGVTTCSSLAEALDEAESQRERVTDALRGLRCQTTREARAVSANPSRWSPLIVVSAAAPRTEAERHRLERLADRTDCGVAVVVPASGDPGVTTGRITVRGDGWLNINGVDPEVRAHQLDDEDVELVAELLDVAADREGTEPEPDEALPRRRPLPTTTPSMRAPSAASTRTPAFDAVNADDAVDVAAGAAPGAYGEADDGVLASIEDLSTVASSAAARNPSGGLAALMADVDVVVRVLGEVEVVRRAGGTWEETRRLEVSRPKVLEVISYLAMRDTAIEREDLEISLFPDGTSAPKTAYNLVSAARKVLGDELFPPSDGRRYRLTDRVVTDYALFYELTAQADETDDPAVRAELLAESLDLVMGEPFTGAGRGFAWVGPHRGIIVAQVIDAAEALAEIHLETGDWRAAEWAARKGLRAFPTDERMYRILMRTASASGNVSGVHRVYRELLQVIADPDAGVAPEDSVHPETLALLEELTGSQRPAS